MVGQHEAERFHGMQGAVVVLGDFGIVVVRHFGGRQRPVIQRSIGCSFGVGTKCTKCRLVHLTKCNSYFVVL